MSGGVEQLIVTKILRPLGPSLGAGKHLVKYLR
jgi:hypothetical protein